MNEPLRGCPLCRTPVADAQLGLRDFRWVADALPGKVAPMDVDAMLEKNGRFLVIELKPKGVPIPLGQRLTLKALVRLGMDVWVVWETPEGKRVEVGAMDRSGNTPFVEDMTVNRLRRKVVDWYNEASREE